MEPANQCPVCAARFRGSRLCSRCGADLEPLMTLDARAWRLRQEARGALAGADFGRALELVFEAQQARRTTAGARLGMLIAWLSKQAGGAVRL